MNPMPSAEVVLLQVRAMLQEMVEQMLTIGERLGTVAQQIGATYRAQPPPPGNGVLTSYTPGETFARGQRQPPSATGLSGYVQSVENALRGEYRRAERAERELADLRARYAHGENNQSHKRDRAPAPKRPTKGQGPAKRSRTGPGSKDAPSGKGKAKMVICVICNGPHAPTECKWSQDHCFRCGKVGHIRYTCPERPNTAAPTPGIQNGNNSTAQHEGRDDEQLRDRPVTEDPTNDSTSEEDPSEEKPSATRPAEPGSPVDDMNGLGTLPTGYRPHGTPEDDGSPDSRVRRLVAVRHWPPGCGRNLHYDPFEGALSREG